MVLIVDDDDDDEGFFLFGLVTVNPGSLPAGGEDMTKAELERGDTASRSSPSVEYHLWQKQWL